MTQIMRIFCIKRHVNDGISLMWTQRKNNSFVKKQHLFKLLFHIPFARFFWNMLLCYAAKNRGLPLYVMLHQQYTEEKDWS